jgi:hypothetical protein
MDDIVGVREGADLVVGGRTEGQIDEMPHSTLWKFLIELDSFLISAQRTLIMSSDEHFIRPGSDGNQIFVSTRPKQFLNFRSTSRRQHGRGQGSNDRMSFFRPGKRLADRH